MKAICVDSCFLIGLYDKGDQYHKLAREYFIDYFDNKPNKIFIPWPILYETVSTRLVKQIPSLTQLMQDWLILRGQNRLIMCDDSDYRDNAFEEYRSEVIKHISIYRNLSLTDRVIRNMLKDQNLKIDALISFNKGDFSDICKLTNCELLG